MVRPLFSNSPEIHVSQSYINHWSCVHVGVEILFNCQLEKLDVLEPGNLYCAPWGLRALTVTVDGDRRVLYAESILNAAGRVPNVAGLGLDKVCVVLFVCMRRETILNWYYMIFLFSAFLSRSGWSGTIVGAFMWMSISRQPMQTSFPAEIARGRLSSSPTLRTSKLVWL